MYYRKLVKIKTNKNKIYSITTLNYTSYSECKNIPNDLKNMCGKNRFKDIEFDSYLGGYISCTSLAIICIACHHLLLRSYVIQLCILLVFTLILSGYLPGACPAEEMLWSVKMLYNRPISHALLIFQ